MSIPTTEELKKKQERLAKQVSILPDHKSFGLHPRDLIFSMDIQYSGDDAYVAIDIQEWDGHVIGQFLYKSATTIPYIPGLFAFREGEVLKPALQELMKFWGMKPALLIVDGHGTAHPRKFGIGCWLGLTLNIPTIGVAKEPLLKYDLAIGPERGDRAKVMLKNEYVGLILRTQKGVKPVYVSAGHLISQTAAAHIILELSSQYRISEPIRRADHVARRFAKGEFEAGMIQI